MVLARATESRIAAATLRANVREKGPALKIWVAIEQGESGAIDEKRDVVGGREAEDGSEYEGNAAVVHRRVQGEDFTRRRARARAGRSARSCGVRGFLGRFSTRGASGAGEARGARAEEARPGPEVARPARSHHRRAGAAHREAEQARRARSGARGSDSGGSRIVQRTASERGGAGRFTHRQGGEQYASAPGPSALQAPARARRRRSALASTRRGSGRTGFAALAQGQCGAPLLRRSLRERREERG